MNGGELDHLEMDLPENHKRWRNPEYQEIELTLRERL